ncbi:MAG TPA: response regulator [Polyangia bacterium]|jgi:CheY-like chemotaxis protein|nr:response regulator [Polyangia bacterium]
MMLSGDPDSGSILVVDDEEDIRQLLGQLLTMEGYEVMVAESGSNALTCLRANPQAVRLILLDLMMPGMNGWQFRTEQLKDPALAAIPAVVMTGAGLKAEDMKALGSCEVLFKPVNVDTLFERIKRYVPG